MSDITLTSAASVSLASSWRVITRYGPQGVQKKTTEAARAAGGFSFAVAGLPSGARLTKAVFTCQAQVDGGGVYTIAGTKNQRVVEIKAPAVAKNGTVISVGISFRGVPTGQEEGLPGTGRLYTAFFKAWGASLKITYTTGDGTGGGGGPAQTGSLPHPVSPGRAGADCFYYPEGTTDFSGNGLALRPLECTITEERNGDFSASLTLAMDDGGAWMRLARRGLLRLPSPARRCPALTIASAETQRSVFVLAAPRGYASLYSKPTSGASQSEMGWALCRLENGARLQKIEERRMAYDNALWYRCTDEASGQTGWIRAALVTAATDGAAATAAVAEPQQRDQLFRVCNLQADTEAHTLTVRARHIFYDGVKAIILPTGGKIEKKAAQAALAALLAAADHPLPYALYTDCTGQVTGDFGGKTFCEALLDPESGIAAQLGAQLVRDNFDVYLLKEAGRESGLRIQHGRNLAGATLTEDSDATANRIIADIDGKTTIVDDPDRAEGAEILAVSRKYDKDGGTAQAQAEQEFAQGLAGGDFTLDVDFVQLAEAAEYPQYAGLQKLFLGDAVSITLPQARLKAEITGIVWDCLLRRYSEVTLGATAVQRLRGSVPSYQLGGVRTGKLLGQVGGYQIADGAIEADKIAAGAITAEKILAGAIEAGKIAAGAIAAEKLAAGAVTAGKIAAGAIEADKLKAGAVTAEKLAAGAVTAEKIAAEAVTAEKIAAGAIEAGKLKVGAVTAEKLAAGAVTAEKIAARTITAEKIAAGTVTAESGILADGVVGTAQIADGSITDAKIVGLTASKITAGTINAAEININNLNADNITAGTINGQRIPVLGGDKIEDGAISGVKIVNGAVETEKIADGAVTAAKIVAEAVTAEKIAAGAVTANKILAGAVTADKLAANAVTADKIAANAITTQQLAASVGSDLDLSSNKSINLKVQAAVDGIQVGGTNLLPDTQAFGAPPAGGNGALTDETYRGLAIRAYDATSITAEFAEFAQWVDAVYPEYGDAYTMSFYAKGSGTLTAYFYSSNNGSSVRPVSAIGSAGSSPGPSDGHWAFPLTSEWERYWVSYKMADTGDKTIGKHVLLRLFKGNKASVCGVKLEKGNKATDWSPAPEDAENRISAAETQIAQNATDISLRATKTELDGLQIGGVNLMQDTKAYGGNGGANYTIVAPLQTETYNGFAVRRGENTSDANALQFKMAYAFQPGESYTLSFWGKGSGAAQALITGYAYPCTSISSEGTAGTDAGGANTFSVSSAWKRYWVTFTMGNWATVPIGKELWLRARTRNDSGRVLDVCGLKLERGSRATDWSPSPEDPARGVKTSSITVAAGSIDIDTGGSLNLNGADMTLNSAASMTIQSGGTFQLTAPEENESYIRFGDADTPNFSASASGDVVAQTLRVAGMWPLLAAMSGLKVSVAQTAPSGSNILWIKPSATSRKTYAYQQSGSDVYIVGEGQQVTLAQADTSTLSGSTFSYTVTLPISEYGGKTHSNVQVHAYLINGSKTIDMGYKQITLYAWVNTTLTYTVTSSINLASAAGNVALKIDTRKDGSKYTTSGIRVQRGGNISASIVSDQGASAGAQSCQVFYIP